MLRSFSTLINSSRYLLDCTERLTNVRYSQYNPNYIEPLITKEERDAIKERGELEGYLLRPIKAAKIDDRGSAYSDPLVNKFVNYIMRDGRKDVAKLMLEKTFEQVKRNQIERYNKATTDEERNQLVLDPLVIFKSAVQNSTPIMKLTKIKRGGQTYQVPYPITDSEARFRACQWLIQAGKDKKKALHLPQKLAWELVDAAENKGTAVKRKLELHRQCEANRAYAHYRWS